MREFYYHYSTAAERALIERRYQQIKKELQSKILEQQKRLVDWILNVSENSQKPYYSIANLINRTLTSEQEKEFETLEYYQDKLSDLLAVNEAINTKQTDKLFERANARMEDFSPFLQGLGVMFGVLAAGLLVGAACSFTPLILLLGGLAASIAFALYQIGSIRVSTGKSTLFSNLKETISPTPELPPLIDDPVMRIDFYEHLALVR